MKKRVLLAFGATAIVAMVSLGLFAAEGSYCRHNPATDVGICEPLIGGGSACTAQKCNGFLQPHCDCYETAPAVPE